MVSISEPDELTFSVYSSDVGCYGDTTGSAYVDNVDGGQSPILFLGLTDLQILTFHLLQPGIIILQF